MWDVGCGVWGVYVEGGGVVCSGSGVYTVQYWHQGNGTKKDMWLAICGVLVALVAW